ncbi:polysaccharide biosynthesis protein [bacterium BRH_c32]|nr:MAG: polysaccharide biosynthesis protein [bacterium BRH_c32]
MEAIKKLLNLNSGHERTVRAKKNILGLIVIRGLNIVIGLLIVPMTIHYLNPTKYGIWITITSLVGWFSFFDIGLGNGLRNKFAEAVAKGEHSLAKTYVSTTYAILISIISVFFVLFIILNNFLNWNNILNSGNDPLFQRELSVLAIIVFASFSMTFVLNLITTILNADQRPAQSSLFDFIGKAVSLLFILLLTKIGDGSLLSLGLIYCFISPFVLFIASIWLFNGKYKIYKPSFKFIDIKKVQNLFNLGVKFFIIQIAAILLYQTNNVIITQLFGPEMVTPYNIAFKYFSILMMGFSIIIAPFWSAFTEAWAKKDIDWIKNIMDKLIKMWFLFVLIGIIMLLSSKFLYKLWVGESISIPFEISVLTMIWALINIFNGIFSQFLNGVGKIKLQLFIGIGIALTNVPLTLVLGKLFGITGVLLANVVLSLVFIWIWPIQYKKIISLNATGLWNK